MPVEMPEPATSQESAARLPRQRLASPETACTVMPVLRVPIDRIACPRQMPRPVE
jgi:hypothetical protein